MVRCRDLHRLCLSPTVPGDGEEGSLFAAGICIASAFLRPYLVTEKRVFWWFAAGICIASAFLRPYLVTEKRVLWWFGA